MKTVEEMPTQSDVCRMIEGTSIFFAGDSIIRDTWIAGAMWLLILDDFNVLKKNLTDTAACFACAWGFLEPAGIIAELRAVGFLQELPPVTIFTVCKGSARLMFQNAGLFSHLSEIFKHTDMHGATALVTSHGILEMSHSPGDADAIAWADALDLHARERIPTVYIGTHHRIIERTPAAWRHVSEQQGNAALRRRHAAVSGSRSPGGLRVVDAFRLTQELGPCYRDTGDGLHFGLWINLQRFWLAVLCLHATLRCEPLGPCESNQPEPAAARAAPTVSRHRAPKGRWQRSG